jgi:hypothetical protein
MSETMTIRQVLEITAQNLRGIMLPVEMMETAGQVLVGSIRNLEACMHAMDEAERGAKNGADPDPE